MRPEDEQATMQREWLTLQRKRLELDAERDKVWLEHITRQTRTMEMQTDALIQMARSLIVLTDLVVKSQ